MTNYYFVKKCHSPILLFLKVLRPLILCVTYGLISQLQLNNSQLCSVLYYVITMCYFRGKLTSITYITEGKNIELGGYTFVL